ncbi:MAG: CehA/McbA family metallohydrolase [Clostridia bacterium]|nr:CehA/McbA family metallohydrolase [Clostridia bacterium]
MLRQAAFEGKRKMLKGGLHCHTTRSDGVLSPEDTIRLHVENGYDFLALTDHRFYNYANYGEAPITIIPGMEMDRNFEGPGVHCFHTVSIGPSRENGNGFKQDERFEGGVIHQPEEYQPILDWLHENNNLTFYCHPDWSSTPAREFENLRGNFAMEIWNSGCVIDNEMDVNALYWDEVLGGGHRLYGVATDDGHLPEHHCKGWVRVNAENNISAILQALKNGAFYSSCGPEIHDFYITDEGVAVVECSPCRYVSFISMGNPACVVRNADGLVTRAEFKVPEHYQYLRVSMIDELGRRAWSNPIFLK